MVARTLHEAALAEVRDVLAKLEPGENEIGVLNSLLRISARWRSEMIANTVEARCGPTVQGGPFAGMRYLKRASEGARAARLIGSYEGELHPHLLALAHNAPAIVDIGCAEGYYAVGLARLLGVPVHAYDTSEAAQALCRELAALNGVEVTVGGEFSGDEFASLAPGTLVIVDIEGGEVELLDPNRWPALRGLPIIVETHPGLVENATDVMAERFRGSHTVQVVHQAPKVDPLPDWFRGLGHLDSLLAVWEWRVAPTPWLVMTPAAAAR